MPDDMLMTKEGAESLAGEESEFDGCPAVVVEARAVENGEQVSVLFEYERGAPPSGSLTSGDHARRAEWEGVEGG